MTAVFLGACGSGDDADSSGAEAASNTSSTASGNYTPQTKQERQALEIAERLNQALAAVQRDGANSARAAGTVCSLMSTQSREELVTAGRVAAGSTTPSSCKNAVQFLLQRSKRLGSLAASAEQRVVGLDIAGTTATARVESADGETSTLALVKQDGRWRLTVDG